MIDTYPGALTDLDARFRIMDKYPGLTHLLNLGSNQGEHFAPAKDAVDLAKLANDEMAELVSKYPDRFVGAIASLPLNDMDAALRELDRAINELGFRGIQIFSEINGKPLDSPEFMPLYEMMAYHDLPIFLHPRRESTMPDYAVEDESRYMVFLLFGWPYETTVAMTRLVCGGVLEKYPKLKVITHHCGGMVPYYADRITALYDFFPQPNTQSPLNYYRKFYGDTALAGSTEALMCGYHFFGASHILFGTDMSYGNQLEDGGTGKIISSINKLNISDAEKKQIFEDNARELFHIPLSSNLHQ